jgi:hypothetical protein
LLRQQAAGDVGAAAGRIGDDDAHRAGGPRGLRERGAGHGGGQQRTEQEGTTLHAMDLQAFRRDVPAADRSTLCADGIGTQYATIAMQ